MSILSLDTETTTHNKGAPYDSRNKLVCYSAATTDDAHACIWSDRAASNVQRLIDASSLVVFFNGKFDIHWLIKHNINFSKTPIWDVQIAEFILSNQTHKFPSLNETCVKYGVATKLDIIKEEFWERKCSCHVSIAKQLVNIMLKGFVGNATVETTNPRIALNATLINGNGEKKIQTCTQLLKNGELIRYAMTLRHRIEQDVHGLEANTRLQILNTLDSWLKTNVPYVEVLRTFVSTTTTQQEKLGTACVFAVTQLWLLLSERIGWIEHTHTCKPTPVQTDDIPWRVLEEYAAHDAAVTLQCYHAQRKLMTAAQVRLCQLMCMDLLVLREMEATGLPFDEQLCATRAQEVDARIQEIRKILSAYYPNVPVNFASNDHLSAFLYGGVVKEEAKEHVGFFKGGAQAGQPKYKNIIIEHQLPRLYAPLRGTELLKEGMFATDESTLRKLKGKKATVDLLLELSKLEKLNGTYYRGLVELRHKMHWPEGLLHGQFNQTTAATGRLSSSKPNLQSFASELQDIFISKYE